MFTVTLGSAAAAAPVASTGSLGGLITTFLASATFIWVFAIVGIIAMAILLENELEGWATTVFSLCLALFLWDFKSEIFGFITSNPAATIGFTISYVVIGIVWSFLKWRTYVKDIFDKFKALKADFIRENGVIDEKNKSHFYTTIESSGLRGGTGRYLTTDSHQSLETFVDQLTPISSKKKGIITSWISYWPVSLLATILNNPFRKFFEWVYSNLSGYYDKITDSYKADALK